MKAKGLAQWSNSDRLAVMELSDFQSVAQSLNHSAMTSLVLGWLIRIVYKFMTFRMNERSIFKPFASYQIDFTASSSNSFFFRTQ